MVVGRALLQSLSVLRRSKRDCGGVDSSSCSSFVIDQGEGDVNAEQQLQPGTCSSVDAIKASSNSSEGSNPTSLPLPAPAFTNTSSMAGSGNNLTLSSGWANLTGSMASASTPADTNTQNPGTVSVSSITNGPPSNMAPSPTGTLPSDAVSLLSTNPGDQGASTASVVAGDPNSSTVEGGSVGSATSPNELVQPSSLGTENSSTVTTFTTVVTSTISIENSIFTST